MRCSRKFPSLCRMAAALALLLALPSVPTAWAENWNRELFGEHYFERRANVNLFLGSRFLDKGDWKPDDRHVKFGLEFDYTGTGWPLGVTAGFFYSKGSAEGAGVEVENVIYEFALGARKIWRWGRVQPFLDAGAMLVNVDAQKERGGRTGNDDDNNLTPGLWAGAGAYVDVHGPWHAGIDLRWTRSEVSVFGSKVDAAGWHAGVLLGYHWTE